MNLGVQYPIRHPLSLLFLYCYNALQIKSLEHGVDYQKSSGILQIIRHHLKYHGGSMQMAKYGNKKTTMNYNLNLWELFGKIISSKVTELGQSCHSKLSSKYSLPRFFIMNFRLISVGVSSLFIAKFAF